MGSHLGRYHLFRGEIFFEKVGETMNYLVYDIGGSYIKYCLMTGDREILFKGKVKPPLKKKLVF